MRVALVTLESVERQSRWMMGLREEVVVALVLDADGAGRG